MPAAKSEIRQGFFNTSYVRTLEPTAKLVYIYLVANSDKFAVSNVTANMLSADLKVNIMPFDEMRQMLFGRVHYIGLGQIWLPEQFRVLFPHTLDIAKPRHAEAITKLDTLGVDLEKFGFTLVDTRHRKILPPTSIRVLKQGEDILEIAVKEPEAIYACHYHLSLTYDDVSWLMTKAKETLTLSEIDKVIGSIMQYDQDYHKSRSSMKFTIMQWGRKEKERRESRSQYQQGQNRVNAPVKKVKHL